MVTTLPVPARNPSRNTNASTIASLGRRCLTSEQLETWKHAMTLYYGFEWQSSAESFVELARQVESELEQAVCLLNSALIYARLGEFRGALDLLGQSQPTKELLPVTVYVMGCIEYELGHLKHSQSYFTTALRALGGRAQTYGRFGVDFELRPRDIKHNLAILRSGSGLDRTRCSISALPADHLFGPSTGGRSFTQSITRSISPTETDSLPQLDDSSDGSPPLSPIDSLTSAFESTNEFPWHHSTGDPDIQMLYKPGSYDMQDDFSAVEPKTLSAHMPPGKLVFSTTESTQHVSTIRSPAAVLPQHDLQSVKNGAKLEPRDARIASGTTRLLATYIRDLPPQDNVLQPKEARVKMDSNRDLVEFIQTQGGESHVPTSHKLRKSKSSHESLAHSTGSIDLLDTTDDNRRLADYSKPARAASKHRYRSGLGSLLLREDTPTTNDEQHSRKSAQTKSNAVRGRSPPVRTRHQAPETSTDFLHGLFCDSAVDNSSVKPSLLAYADEITGRSSRSPHSFTTLDSSSALSEFDFDFGELCASTRTVEQAVRPTIPRRVSSLRQTVMI